MTRPSPLAVPDTGTGPAPTGGNTDQLLDGLVRVTASNPGMMTGPGTNTYLVGEGEVAVVDPGPDDEAHRRAILAAAAARGATIRWIVVTHTHIDHAPGAMPLASAVGAELIGYDERDGFVPDHAARDGWTLAAPSFRLSAVHTPGHAGNHLCWLFEDHGVLLTGDHVMHGSTVVIRPPDGDMTAYLASLRRLLAMNPPLVAFAPGHGRLMSDTDTVVAAVVAHRLDREEVVATALAAAGRATVDDLAATVYADVDPKLLPVARFSLWAHLRKLGDDGLAVGPPPHVDQPGDNGPDLAGLTWTWEAV